MGETVAYKEALLASKNENCNVKMDIIKDIYHALCTSSFFHTKHLNIYENYMLPRQIIYDINETTMKCIISSEHT